MKKYEDSNGHFLESAPSYVCSTTEFVQTTNATDGSSLEVIDESTHTVTGYYIAYKGYWNKR